MHLLKLQRHRSSVITFITCNTLTWVVACGTTQQLFACIVTRWSILSNCLVIYCSKVMLKTTHAQLLYAQCKIWRVNHRNGNFHLQCNENNLLPILCHFASCQGVAGENLLLDKLLVEGLRMQLKLLASFQLICDNFLTNWKLRLGS